MAGLLPILWSTGTGSEIMQRIAVPMVGGMISSTLLIGHPGNLRASQGRLVGRRRVAPLTLVVEPPEQTGLLLRKKEARCALNYATLAFGLA